MSSELEELRAAKDGAYRERNVLVAVLARLFPSGIRKTQIEGWDPEWEGCVYIDLPEGQVSFHYHDSEADLFANLPPYTRPYDGHSKEDAMERIKAVMSGHPRMAFIPDIRSFFRTRLRLANSAIDMIAPETIGMWSLVSTELDKAMESGEIKCTP